MPITSPSTRYRIRILACKLILSSLLKALTQLRGENTSEELLMIVRQIAHSLYGVKVMTTGVRQIKLLLI